MHRAMRMWSEQKLPSQPARVLVIVYPACFKEGESEDDDAPAIVFQAFFVRLREGWGGSFSNQRRFTPESSDWMKRTI